LERRRAARWVENLRALMRQPAARDVFYTLAFERGKLHGSSFHGHQKDGLSNALCTAHAEGRRALAGELVSELQRHCMPQYLEMMNEQVTQRGAELLQEQRAASQESEEESNAS
jgi:hypothetical protein